MPWAEWPGQPCLLQIQTGMRVYTNKPDTLGLTLSFGLKSQAEFYQQLCRLVWKLVYQFLAVSLEMTLGVCKLHGRDVVERSLIIMLILQLNL